MSQSDVPSPSRKASLSGPDASVRAARVMACVSMYSRIVASLPPRTVMASTQRSSNGLFVALIFPVATPMTRTRSLCKEFRRRGVVHLHFIGRLPKHVRDCRMSAVLASSPGMIHSMSSATSPRSLLVAEADGGEEVLYDLDVVPGAHVVFSVRLISRRGP